MKQLLPWILVLTAACGGTGPAVQTGDAGFIALGPDFDGYESWEMHEIDGGVIDPVHTSGPRRVFINDRPVGQNNEFPKGTIIVKEAPFNTFAMAKRGPGYNVAGAVGWEWFELVKATNGQNVIKWRGLGPPIGEKYGKSGQTCNDCHRAAAATNDYVLDSYFTLTK